MDNGNIWSNYGLCLQVILPIIGTVIGLALQDDTWELSLLTIVAIGQVWLSAS